MIKNKEYYLNLFGVSAANLEELASHVGNAVIIASDHTRPVPSKVIIPPMLEEIRKGIMEDVSILPCGTNGPRHRRTVCQQ